MATTSPDGIRTPNPSDPYNLVADMAITASDTQAALVKRANLYIGTSTQRTAFTTAPEGTHWQDTNGTRLEYIRQSSAWVQAVPTIGVTNVRTGTFSGTTAYTTVTFSTPFPAGTVPAVTTQIVSGSSGAIGVSAQITSVTNTSFSARISSGGPFNVSYIAAA